MNDIQKPMRPPCRPRVNSSRPLTRREINKRYRDRQRAKLELLKKLIEQGTVPDISDGGLKIP